AGALGVVDAGAADECAVERPPVPDARQVALQLPQVQGLFVHARPIVAGRRASRNKAYVKSDAAWGPTQATAATSSMLLATSATSSKVTASRAATAASGSTSSP